MLVVVFILGATALAQNVKIVLHAVDGRNGKPIANRHLLVKIRMSGDAVGGWANHLDLKTDKDGLAALTISATDAELIQVWVDALTLCQSDPNHASFSVSTIISNGLSAPNNCGPLRLNGTPGHFMFFARPATLMERMRW